MTTDERLNTLTQSVQYLERVTRQGFQVLTELHGETQREMQTMSREMQKMSNALSTLIELHADHERRLDGLEGK